ncbi:transcription factor GTE1 [Copidosoma floridanum]|uniref:transcription factor GTE1 n=1 Tax=Copidosoma floridanum TaxID=29053 RepID=UPI0006C9E583|nr:transcription factor GTE1 [Copidosoma floridanum]
MQTGSLKVSVDVSSTIKIENLAKSEPYLSCEQIFMDKNTNFNNHAEERKRVEKSKSSQKTEAVSVLLESKIDSLRSKTGNVVEIKDIKQKQGTCETTKHCSSNRQKDILTGSAKILSREEKDEKNQKNEVETKKNEPVKHRKTNVCKNSEEYFVIESKIFLKTENVEEFKQKSVKKEENKQSDIENLGLIKIEPKQEYDNNTRDCQENEKEMKNENEILVKKENAESAGSTEEIDEEESIISKLSINKTMKTYSKKQTSTNDSEPENEGSGETADYKSWKKLIMSVYNTLATHKYASIFLRPITEDQAPGYHSIIFRPMDLSTVKKNIDNGTIRSTTHFQRDIMLMFQNAIMFNKDNTFVFKMTLEMREECLQHMQIFVQAAGEASSREHNRRETRTATNVSNDVADSGLKRKWSNITLSPHEIESPRLKKRKKSENDLN